MSRKNDVTGADLVTKAATNQYREGFDRVFGNKVPWYKRRDACSSNSTVSWPPADSYILTSLVARRLG